MIRIPRPPYHVYFGGSNNSINGGAGNDYIFNASHSTNVTINGAAGNDSISNSGSYVTIDGGAGNDSITLNSSPNFITYKSGDGNDSIVGFDASSSLQIGNGEDTYSKETVGENIIVTVGDGKITLVGAASLSEVNILGTEKAVETNSWTLSGTTAKYGMSNKTLVTVKGVKSIKGLSLNENVVTVSKVSHSNKNVTVSDDYTLKLGSDVTKSTVKNKTWSLKSTTATYKGTSTAGYALASDSKSITYSKGGTTTLATVKGVKSLDGLKLSGTTITVFKDSLNAKNVTVSDGYTLKLGSNVTKSTTKEAWSLKSSTATYKQTTSAGYSLENNSIVYSKAATTKTLATVKGVKSTSELSVKNDVVTLKSSALTNKVTISGGYEFDFASDYTKATITGSDSDDTITARGKNISIGGGKGDDAIKLINAGLVKGGAGADIITGGSGKDSIYGDAGNDKLYGGSGNDSLWGGAGNDSLWGDDGNDTFIYKPGEGTDTIYDYSSGDILKILKKKRQRGQHVHPFRIQRRYFDTCNFWRRFRYLRWRQRKQ